VFQLSPAAGGTWAEKILHNFGNNGKGGATPPLARTLFLLAISTALRA
jgi:hypothetical protein